MAMIASMTGYAQQEAQGEWGRLVCELRSVNQRFLEPGFRLPEEWRSLEPALRERLKQKVQRGRVDCTVKYEPPALATAELHLQWPMIERLVAVQQELATWTEQQPIVTPWSPADLLRWPGVVVNTPATEQVAEQILSLFDATLQQYSEARVREGASLAKLIEERLATIEQTLHIIDPLVPGQVEQMRERLIKRFGELKLTLDAERLEQEMVLYAQKIDVAEEIDRTRTHLQEMKRLLKQGGVAGKQLDFILQELNREANTLGAKSAHADISHAVVTIKVAIEQMREQVQNIE